MSSTLMETVPGGETPQYESIKTVTEPAQKEKGQLGGADAASAERPAGSMDAEKGQKKVENIRYGQNMSESGMGGKTTGVEGEAHQGGVEGLDSRDPEEKSVDARREQGHGAMPPIGA